MKTYSLLLTGLFLFMRSISSAQPGTPDNSFSSNGFLTESVLTNHHNVGIKTLVQTDGKILVGAAVYGNGLNENTAILRYLPDGTPDPSYHSGSPVFFQFAEKEVYMHDMALQPDGKLLVCVNIYNLNNAHYTPALFRLLTDGTPDPAFGGSSGVLFPDISGYTDVQYNAVQVLSDGKIALAGVATPDTGNAFEQFAAFRLNVNGMPDTGFSGDGFTTTPVGDAYVSVEGIAVQSDGKIIVGGTATVNGFDDFAVVRFNANGTPDASFNGDGIGIYSLSDQNDRSTGLQLQTDGKILLGGYAHFQAGNSGSDFAALRLTASGDPDLTFNDDGMVIIPVLTANTDGARDILLQPDGKIVLGGFLYTANLDCAMVRLLANGTPDNSFGGDGIVTFAAFPDNSDEIYDITFQPDGKIVATGFGRAGEYNTILLARFISGILVGTNQVETPETNVTIYPNPATNHIQLEYDLTAWGPVSISLYDLQGRLAQNLLTAVDQTAGKHSETLLFRSGLAPGTYLLRLQAGQGSSQVKVVVD